MWYNKEVVIQNREGASNRMKKKIKRGAANFLIGALFVGLLFSLCSWTQANRDKAYQFTSSEPYIVSEGETLWSIAKMYSTNKHDTRKVIRIIKELTGKENSSIQVNETLIIPLFDNID